jgi:hypothetical protein
MARFQLAGPAADVSKILYGESRQLYGGPKRTIQYLRRIRNVPLSRSSIFFIESVLAQCPALTASRAFKVLEIVLFVWAPHTIGDFQHTKV